MYAYILLLLNTRIDENRRYFPRFGIKNVRLLFVGRSVIFPLSFSFPPPPSHFLSVILYRWKSSNLPTFLARKKFDKIQKTVPTVAKLNPNSFTISSVRFNFRFRAEPGVLRVYGDIHLTIFLLTHFTPEHFLRFVQSHTVSGCKFYMGST